MSNGVSNRRELLPSAVTIASRRLPRSRTTTTARFPSGDTAGGSANGASTPRDTSKTSPFWTRHNPSAPVLADKKNNDVPEKRGARARDGASAYGLTSRSSAARSRIGTLHRVAVG